MHKKDRPEFYMTIAFICFFLSSMEIAYFKYTSDHFDLNGDRYIVSGVLRQQDPKNGKDFFIPIYSRRK